MKLAAFSVVLAVAAILSGMSAPRDLGPKTPGPIQFMLSTTFSTGAYPSGIAAGDFNNDGIPDLAYVSSHDGAICVALGNGDGTFGPCLDSSSSYSPYTVAVGKFDGENLDAVVGDLDYGNGLAMFGDGTGYFTSNTPLITNDHVPGGIVVGDFNGDGNNDVAMTDTAGQGHVYLFLGNGDGTFQPVRKFSTGGHVPTVILAGDFNGDGKLDLAVLNTAGGVSHGSLAILLGRGNGSFDAPLLYKFPERENHERTALYNPSAIAVGDFNNDNRLDVAVSFRDSILHDMGYARILLGNGDGTFQQGALENAGQQPNWIAAADFNGDGNTDLVLACAPDENQGEISVLVGNGDGTFQPRVTFPVDGSAPVQLAVADFNGDGKPDVATVNQSSSTISVLLNTTVFPHIGQPPQNHSPTVPRFADGVPS